MRLIVTVLIFILVNITATQSQTIIAENTRINKSIPNEKMGYKLVWHDEFNIDGSPNPLNWGYEYGFVRNRELQWYQPQNAYCYNGYLIIEGREEVVPNTNFNPSSGDWRSSSENANYTSACLITKGLQEWGPYGYYEIRARIDTAYGSWPAIWLLGTNNSWPHGGEIDIMEFYRIDDNPTILANLAWGTEVQYKPKWSSSKLLYKEFLEKDKDWHKKFHVWSMSWDEDYIKIFIDQELIHETNLNEVQNPDNKNPFAGDNKFYILLNLALGSNGGEPISSELPITYEIDYVRVYR